MTPPHPSKVTTIDATRDIVTLVNTFTVTPQNQQPFIDAQIGEYERLAGKIVGSLAVNLHRGVSGRKVVNYAQFRSVEDFRGWTRSDLMKEHLPIVRPYIVGGQPGLYRVESVASRNSREVGIEESHVALISALTIDPGTLLGDVVTAHRPIAQLLVNEHPGLRSAVIHVGIERSSPSEAREGPNIVLYAQLDSETSGRTLLRDPLYREWFSIDNPAVRTSESDIYDVVYVRNQAASPAPEEDSRAKRTIGGR